MLIAPNRAPVCLGGEKLNHAVEGLLFDEFGNDPGALAWVGTYWRS